MHGENLKLKKREKINNYKFDSHATRVVSHEIIKGVVHKVFPQTETAIMISRSLGSPKKKYLR